MNFSSSDPATSANSDHDVVDFQDQQHSPTAEQQQEEEQPVLLCSVLTTVVDHIMVDPTPMEPREFHQKQQRDIKVPVVRVFGPILRRDGDTLIESPKQSACLYIHGAFPYLLARPVVAGPDGALHGAAYSIKSSGGGGGRNKHISWDCPKQVQSILPILQDALEATLQNSLSGNSNNNNTSTATIPQSPRRFIRQLTVRMGRGFYTYCPGPAAPFVRVEYYDPSQRWRIKLALENGLEKLPKMVFPDRKQYDVSLCLEDKDNEGEQSDSDDEDDDSSGKHGLQFHCYEAHIPYTMQFFKDYNLAGMSYVHIRRALFRRDIPRTLPRRFKHEHPNNDQQQEEEQQHLFLRSNTESVWLLEEELTTSVGSAVMQDDTVLSDAQEDFIRMENLPDLHQATPPDEEEDIPGDGFLGGQSLSLESDKKERRTQHEDDISPTDELPNIPGPWSKSQTSCQVELDCMVQDILNVQSILYDSDNNDASKVHWRAVPSLADIWQQERRRMQRLLSPKDDFLSQTTEEQEQQQTPPPLTLSVSHRGTSGAKLALEGMQSLLRVTQRLEQSYVRAAKDVVKRHEDIIQRVDTKLRVAAQQQRSKQDKMATDTDNDAVMNLTPSDEAALKALEELVTAGMDGTGADVTESKAGNYDEAVEHKEDLVTTAKQQTDTDVFDNTWEDEVAITELSSQDSNAMQLFRSNGSVNDSSQQLTKGQQLEVALSQATYLTQKAGSSISSKHHIWIDWDAQLMLTQRIDRGDGIIDGPLEHIDEYIDPGTLRPYEYMDDDDTVDDEEYPHAIEQETEMMDGSEASFHRSSDGTDRELLSQHGCLDIEDTKGEAVDQLHDEETDGSDASDSNLSAPRYNHLHVLPVHDSPTTGRTCEFPSNVVVERSCKPPTRGNLLHAHVSGLFPMERGYVQPSWLAHSTRYHKLYPHRSGWTIPVPRAGTTIVVSRTCPPPKRKAVASWLTRQGVDETMPSAKARKRQRIQSPDPSLKAPTEERQIEEVVWRSSQVEMTQTQRSEKEYDHSQSQQEKSNAQNGFSLSMTRSTPEDPLTSDTQTSQGALKGIGNQGGRIHIEGGGELKAKIRPSQRSNSRDTRELPSPVSLMAVEIHVQCRKGKDASARAIAMTPQPDRDRVSAVVYVFGVDPGGGEALRVIECGCLMVASDGEMKNLHAGSEKHFLKSLENSVRSSMPSVVMGKVSPLSVECFLSERHLMTRFASLVRWKDPDMLCSWDTQGAGLGYLIERSAIMNETANKKNKTNVDFDLAKLLGRTPTMSLASDVKDIASVFQYNDDADERKMILGDKKSKWKGSGLGADWDERVGAGAAAASVIGRLVFASWKLVAEEVKHANASYLQAVVFSVTGNRIPFHDNLKLTGWYSDSKGKERWRVLHHKLVEAMSTVVLFDALDLIGRAGEAARLSGVEFSQSFPGIRGSQYKVEGVLLRALQSLNSEDRGAKRGHRPSTMESKSLSSESKSQTQSPWKGRRGLATTKDDAGLDNETRGLSGRGYFFYSPSLRGADRQESLQVQALTLEPRSGHYQDPVVVCDFTALYPSLVIAYNLCYSTISGHLDYQSTRDEMLREGRTTGKIGPFDYPEGRSATVLKHHIKSLTQGEKADRAYIAPTGDIYVSETVLVGVLPKVLNEMLTTRAMLKKAAKLYKKNVKGLSPAILRQLEARQLALKYVANVTYGYTSATFSGRCAMPLLADTIVECGRRTLTNAINLANCWGRDQHGRWKGCEVIYGDTDSIFVRLPGRSVHEAFVFGEEFCKTVTKNNPPPVELKLEKVYLGSIMQTKKKYCGMKFESKEQKKPEFEAKGIETIRRDQCALTQKVLRNALKTLFSSGLGAVKEYLTRQWRLIDSGKLSIADFILTGRVRSKYRKSLPVQAALARRLTEVDPGRIVRHKERLAYVIVAAPGTAVRLSDSAMTPLELLEHWDLHSLNTTYYITKHVNAALQRCLGLSPHNVDVHEWYRTTPKPRKRIHFWPSTGRSSMISFFFGSDICWFCSRKSKVTGRSHVSVCAECRSTQARSVETTLRRMNSIQQDSLGLAQKCSRCNLCFEDARTFAALEPRPEGTKTKVQAPLANCTCIDCPIFYQRHRAREDELEMQAVFQALGL